MQDNVALVGYAVSQLAARLPRHVPRDELVSAAMAGLAQAARSFDPDRDTRFDHYASARIRGALLDELRDRDWASRSVRSRAKRLLSTREGLTAALGREPTTAELAGALELEPGAVETVLGDIHRSVVLNFDSILTDGSHEALLPADGRSPEVVLLEREQRAYLRDAVDALPARLRHVVVGYFYEERPMQELAEELGVSPSRVSQMRGEAVALLKEGIAAQLDPEPEPPADKRRSRSAGRKAAYAAAVAGASDYRSRLSSGPRPSLTTAPA